MQTYKKLKAKTQSIIKDAENTEELEDEADEEEANFIKSPEPNWNNRDSSLLRKKQQDNVTDSQKTTTTKHDCAASSSSVPLIQLTRSVSRREDGQAMKSDSPVRTLERAGAETKRKSAVTNARGKTAMTNYTPTVNKEPCIQSRPTTFTPLGLSSDNLCSIMQDDDPPWIALLDPILSVPPTPLARPTPVIDTQRGIECDSTRDVKSQIRHLSQLPLQRPYSPSEDPTEGGYESPSATPFCIMRGADIQECVSDRESRDEPFITIPFILRLPPENPQSHTQPSSCKVVSNRNASDHQLSKFAVEHQPSSSKCQATNSVPTFEPFLSWASKHPVASDCEADDDYDNEDSEDFEEDDEYEGDITNCYRVRHALPRESSPGSELAEGYSPCPFGASPFPHIKLIPPSEWNFSRSESREAGKTTETTDLPINFSNNDSGSSLGLRSSKYSGEHKLVTNR